MIIKPTIKNNVSFTAHPLGIETRIKEQLMQAQQLAPINGGKKVLVLGGSTGLGLATRLNLAIGSRADTISVALDGAPSDTRSGAAGFWNSYYTNQLLTTGKHFDITSDVFAEETKQKVAKLIQQEFGQIDTLVYSIASGKKVDRKTDQTIYASLKTTMPTFITNNLSLAQQTLFSQTVETATAQEVTDTVAIMGGDDWSEWIHFLLSEQLLADNFTTFTYSYDGSEITQDIYRNGTIGAAKKDLEATAITLNDTLQKTIQGHALVIKAPAVITKASMVIPGFALYSAVLLQVLKQQDLQETLLTHVHRVLTTLIYRSFQTAIVRSDERELASSTQNEIKQILAQITNDNLTSLLNPETLIQEFLAQNGFGFATVDYQQDVDMNNLLEQNPIVKW